jgi:hypothetical protein
VCVSVHRYDFFLRNLLHYTERSHEFHAMFQKAHAFVLSALKELQAAMEADTEHHVADLLKVGVVCSVCLCVVCVCVCLCLCACVCMGVCVVCVCMCVCK